MHNGELCSCSVRTTAKKIRIVVGDCVNIEPNEYDAGKCIITSVNPRKNSIPRPPLANIDKLLIVVAPKPEPDFLLVDKLIIYCMLNSIEPVIVVNKIDLAQENFANNIRNQYPFLKIFEVSAIKSSGVDKLIKYIGNSLAAVCGQSAVGKSSLLNAIIPTLELETQGLSRKVDRGKHTTRVNEIYIYDNVMLADTPGFSNLELNIDYRELSSFYPEFENYLGKCRYLDCSHVKEGKDCVIISALNSGDINSERYQRYCTLHDKLKLMWENKYD